MKLNLREFTRAINENRFAPEKGWTFEEIEHVKELETCDGHMDVYEVTVRIKAGKYQDNAIKYQVNHYTDEEVYVAYYDGSCYLG